MTTFILRVERPIYIEIAGVIRDLIEVKEEIYRDNPIHKQLDKDAYLLSGNSLSIR